VKSIAKRLLTVKLGPGAHGPAALSLVVEAPKRGQERNWPMRSTMARNVYRREALGFLSRKQTPAMTRTAPGPVLSSVPTTTCLTPHPETMKIEDGQIATMVFVVTEKAKAIQRQTGRGLVGTALAVRLGPS